MMRKTAAILVAFFCYGIESIVLSAVCKPSDTPKTYLDLKNSVDSQIKTFANKKIVAEQADSTLSKLISSKSPLVTSWMNKRDLGSKSEDEVVREWRDYFARNFILTRYPHSAPGLNVEIEKLMDSINDRFRSKDIQTKMQNRFSKSKDAALSFIKTLPIQEAERKRIATRIEAIQLYWMKTFKNSKFKQLPLDFLDWGIAYDPVANEINIGINALSYPNEETYLAVFLHEIGHSFDSCRWSTYFEGEWPFTKVGGCLRSSSSVAAKRRDDSQLEVLVKENKIASDLAASLKANPTCNKLSYPPAGLQADQLPESFADWFSAEVLATIQGINSLDVRADLCENRELSQGSSYVSNDLRLNAIYRAHPNFKKSSDGEEASPYQHCGLDYSSQPTGG